MPYLSARAPLDGPDLPRGLQRREVVGSSSVHLEPGVHSQTGEAENVAKYVEEVMLASLVRKTAN